MNDQIRKSIVITLKSPENRMYLITALLVTMTVLIALPAMFLRGRQMQNEEELMESYMKAEQKLDKAFQTQPSFLPNEMERERLHDEPRRLQSEVDALQHEFRPLLSEMSDQQRKKFIEKWDAKFSERRLREIPWPRILQGY